jgi:hypothetical protein
MWTVLQAQAQALEAWPQMAWHRGSTSKRYSLRCAVGVDFSPLYEQSTHPAAAVATDMSMNAGMSKSSLDIPLGRGAQILGTRAPM